MKTNKILVYDTTLRDGAQGEGVSFSGAGKLELAVRMDKFGVDYIEGGYAGSNRKDNVFFRQIRKADLTHAKIVAFGSTRRVGTKIRDDRSVKDILAAETCAVALVAKSWKMHVKTVLGTTPRENLAMISDTVEFMKEHGREAIFDAEHFYDGYMEDPDFAMATLERAARAGADALVLCETNGGRLPDEVFEITREVTRKFRLVVGIHTHNDSGLAVANTLAAVRAGATMVQGTLNGLGERCGNADLCSVLPGLVLKMGKSCAKPGSLGELRDLSLFVSDMLNLRPNPKAPYVGQSAFTHKAGTHINAVRKNPKTYEHMDPKSVGNERRMLVSELSGQSSVLMKAIELGVGSHKSKAEAQTILAALKDMESRGYAFEAADASFKILIQKVLKEHKPFFELLGFRVIVEKRGKNEPCLSEATIKVRVNKEVEQTASEGDGPVNALDGALRKALLRFYPEIAKVVLTDFRVNILDPEEATAAKTRVIIESSDGRETWGTVGVSGNVIEASWEALVDSVEYKLFKEEEQKKSKHG